MSAASPRALLLAFWAAAAGCAQPAHPSMPSPSTPSTPGECSTPAAQFIVGRVLDDTLADEARRRAGAQRVRVVRPGQMVTMEFDPGRLTIRLDAAGRVEAATCG